MSHIFQIKPFQCQQSPSSGSALSTNAHCLWSTRTPRPTQNLFLPCPNVKFWLVIKRSCVGKGVMMLQKKWNPLSAYPDDWSSPFYSYITVLNLHRRRFGDIYTLQKTSWLLLQGGIDVLCKVYIYSNLLLSNLICLSILILLPVHIHIRPCPNILRCPIPGRCIGIW